MTDIPPGILHYCGRPITELSKQELENVLTELFDENKELNKELSQLRRKSFPSLHMTKADQESTPVFTATHSMLCSPNLPAPIGAVGVIEAIRASVIVELRPGWHTATISFKLGDDGSLQQLKDYKISSFGEDMP